MTTLAERTAVLDSLIEGCQIISPEWRYLYVNEAAAKQGQSTREKLIGRTMMEVYPGIDQTPLADDIRRCLKDGTRFMRENEFAYPDGSLGWFELRIQPVPDGVFILSLDITQIKRGAERQRLSDERYRQIVETTSEGVVVTDANGRISYANRRFGEILGYAQDEVVGRKTLEFMDSESGALAAVKLKRRMQGIAENHEHRFRHRDGHDVWVRANSTPQIDAQGQTVGSIALLTDVTMTRQAEQARSQLAAIVESSTDAILGKDLDGKINAWSVGAERLFGFSRAEILGQLGGVLVPDALVAEEAAVMRRIAAGEGVTPYETQRRRKDGSLVEVSMVVSSIRDASREVIGISMIARDLTERRKAEALLSATEAQLRQAQKMEAVGSLAGGVAHDFNNLLSVIMSYTGIAIDELRQGEPMRADLQEVYAAAERASGLTRQLLAFSRQQIIKPEVVDLNQIVHGLQKMLGRLVGEHIQLSILDSPGLGSTFVDPGQIEQVIMNLVVNARDAMGPGGYLTVETSNVRLDEVYTSQHVEVTPGDYVMMAVTDTGTGMDAATQARIFEPFYTTKEKGKGTGLGLSTVYGIVKQSGGHIWVYSEPGHGTTFKVYLPRTQQRPSAVPADPPPAVVSLQGTETILLVEDEDAVRATMRTILRKQGYNVLEAQNGGEALLICEQFTATIHLLLTDVIMPRMNGRQLASRLGTLRPEMQVLFVSGYTENSIVHHGVLETGINYLPKPITPNALARKVRELLGPK